MKQKYRDIRIYPKRLFLIERANSVLEDYMKQGYHLTLRQLYYQLVAKLIIPNTIQEYQKLSSTMVAARMSGLTDWGALEDRVRQPCLPYWVTDIPDAINDTIRDYRLPRQLHQPYHMEIWTEKDAVSSILKRVSSFYHIYLMVNRGYSSCSAMKGAADRIINTQKPTKIFYAGDHDPSGLDMLRDIRERLGEFRVEGFEVVPVALTEEQIRKYNPPPNPTKISDPRAHWYIKTHGKDSWELDALQPQVLERLMREAVRSFMDKEKFVVMLDREKHDKRKLKKIMEELK